MYICKRNKTKTVMKLKAYHSFVIFAMLVISAVFSSVSNYHHAQYAIIKDMDQALSQTLRERQDHWITPDTIQSYRSHLHIGLLKETSILSYVLEDKHKGKNVKGNLADDRDTRLLNSRQMFLGRHSVQGYANVSMADVFGISNQRTPLSLTLAAVAWAIFSVFYHRRKQELVAAWQTASVGTLAYSKNDHTFYNKDYKQAVRFTPMQHQLMLMFFENECHRLTKQEICNALWPKKPDASETLYTLIRRIKPIIESNSDLMIESERGKAYRLVVR